MKQQQQNPSGFCKTFFEAPEYPFIYSGNSLERKFVLEI